MAVGEIPKDPYQDLSPLFANMQAVLSGFTECADELSDSDLKDRILADISNLNLLIGQASDLTAGVHLGAPASLVDVDALLRNLVEDAADVGHQTCFVAGCESWLQVCPQSLQRMVLNLMDNAIKYAGSAEVRADRIDGGLVIRVQDRGPGIPEDRIGAALTPFVRCPNQAAPQPEGTGLGLAIVGRLVVDNGGSLQVANRSGGGLDVALHFPSLLVLRD